MEICTKILKYYVIYLYATTHIRGLHRWPVAKTLPAKQGMQVQSLGQEDPLEKEMATYSSILENPLDRGAWRATVHGVRKSWK